MLFWEEGWFERLVYGVIIFSNAGYFSVCIMDPETYTLEGQEQFPGSGVLQSHKKAFKN